MRCGVINKAKGEMICCQRAHWVTTNERVSSQIDLDNNNDILNKDDFNENNSSLNNKGPKSKHFLIVNFESSSH